MDFLLRLFIPVAHAIDTCPFGSLTCESDIGLYVGEVIIPALRYAFMGILFAMVIYYAIKLLTGAFSDSTAGEAKIAYLYAFIGTVLVLSATVLADTVVTFELLNADAGNTILNTVVRVLTLLAGTALLFNITINAIRLIVATEDGARQTAYKHLVFGITGAILVVLAGSLVSVFFDIDSGRAIDEVMGLIRFFTTLVGVLAFVGVVISGILLVVSYEDSVKDKARTILITSIIALIIVIASYAIVSFFIF